MEEAKGKRGKENKTSIQWTPDIKFISATIKKILVKNDFWTTKSKKIPEKKFQKFFFGKQNLQKKFFEKKIFLEKKI